MDWLLDPTVTYLNHGSYGACPRPVFDAYHVWQRELEREPVDLLWRRLPGLLDETRGALGAFVAPRPPTSRSSRTRPRASTRRSARYASSPATRCSPPGTSTGRCSRRGRRSALAW